MVLKVTSSWFLRLPRDITPNEPLAIPRDSSATFFLQSTVALCDSHMQVRKKHFRALKYNNALMYYKS